MRPLLTLELYDAAARLRKELEHIYPNCFFLAGLEQPLKIGIMEDLLAVRETLKISPAPTEEELYAFVLVYTSSLNYRVALIREGSVRIDLEGNIGTPITDRERLIAKSRPLAPHWKLSEEELSVIREQRKEAERKRRARYKANRAQRETEAAAKSLVDTTKAEENSLLEKCSKVASDTIVINPNLLKEKLTLKKNVAK